MYISILSEFITIVYFSICIQYPFISIAYFFLFTFYILSFVFYDFHYYRVSKKTWTFFENAITPSFFYRGNFSKFFVVVAR